MFLKFKNRVAALFAPKSTRGGPNENDSSRDPVINMNIYNSTINMSSTVTNDIVETNVQTFEKNIVNNVEETRMTKDAFFLFNQSVVSHVYSDAFYNSVVNNGEKDGDKRHSNAVEAIRASIFVLEAKMLLVVMPSTGSYWLFYDPMYWAKKPENLVKKMRFDQGHDVNMGLLNVKNIVEAIQQINTFIFDVDTEKKVQVELLNVYSLPKIEQYIDATTALVKV